MPEERGHIWQLGKRLHVQLDGVVDEPLPTLWVDLIQALNEREQVEEMKASERPQPLKRTG